MRQACSKKETTVAESKSDAEQDTIIKLNEILQAEKFTEENTQTDLFEEFSQVDDVSELGARFTKTLRVETFMSAIQCMVIT